MSDKEWHLNRNVTISMIFGLLINLVYTVSYVTNLTRDVRDNTVQISAQAENIAAVYDTINRLEERINKQDVTLARISETLENIEKTLETITEAVIKPRPTYYPEGK